MKIDLDVVNERGQTANARSGVSALEPSTGFYRIKGVSWDEYTKDTGKTRVRFSGEIVGGFPETEIGCLVPGNIGLPDNKDTSSAAHMQRTELKDMLQSRGAGTSGSVKTDDGALFLDHEFFVTYTRREDTEDGTYSKTSFLRESVWNAGAARMQRTAAAAPIANVHAVDGGDVDF